MLDPLRQLRPEETSLDFRDPRLFDFFFPDTHESRAYSLRNIKCRIKKQKKLTNHDRVFLLLEKTRKRLSFAHNDSPLCLSYHLIPPYPDFTLTLIPLCSTVIFEI